MGAFKSMSDTERGYGKYSPYRELLFKNNTYCIQYVTFFLLAVHCNNNVGIHELNNYVYDTHHTLG